MSSNSRKYREKLKQEYKQHYRKMRAAKEQFRRVKKQKNIIDALKDMNSDELMESFDSFLFEVQSKVANAEARLDVALEDIDVDVDADANYQENPAQNHEYGEQSKAKETLQQVKYEMGLLYSELEQQAQELNVDKTVGTTDDNSSPER
jgi:hypothetical protein